MELRLPLEMSPGRATQIQPGTSSYSVTLTGIGTQNYDVYVDGFPYNTQTVEFSNG